MRLGLKLKNFVINCCSKNGIENFIFDYEIFVV